VTTIHLACLAIGLPATVLGELSEARGFLIVGQAVLVLTIVALLEHAGRSRANASESAKAAVKKAEPEPEAKRLGISVSAEPQTHGGADIPVRPASSSSVSGGITDVEARR
jgi:hypothetical protein